jgi:hypothetical protein
MQSIPVCVWFTDEMFLTKSNEYAVLESTETRFWQTIIRLKSPILVPGSKVLNRIPEYH